MWGAAKQQQQLHTFSVPMNKRCSQKCANPWRSSGSERWPTFTSMAAEALSVVGSEMRRTSIPFSSMMSLQRYRRWSATRPSAIERAACSNCRAS